MDTSLHLKVCAYGYVSVCVQRSLNIDTCLQIKVSAYGYVSVYEGL